MMNTAVGVMMKEMIMSDKYFNVTEHERKEKRKELLATAFVWSVLGFSVIGVLATFSLLLTMVWS